MSGYLRLTHLAGGTSVPDPNVRSSLQVFFEGMIGSHGYKILKVKIEMLKVNFNKKKRL